ncbi:ankyrin repeat domain-containing protein [Pseudoxanthomonas winnipegensis]|uniref:ankyrin repeat domain-containing protein n=1 Tax=Pseudoxanthomonas winnipegensis TaxID=2480810 RepID=UPI00102D7B29|nr:ankyrin repeat domain-containing protein [Pseudoxanthomonas winnipegensis]RZZ89220.1 ankyrin repeat domain-containing protein [Pseudoxanthomonas winnipegensis]
MDDDLVDAFYQRDINRMKELIAAGADVNALDGDEMQSALLHSAAYFGFTDRARLLIEAGADLNIENIGKYTPLHIAVQNGSIEIAAMLVDAGADVEARCDDEEAPTVYDKAQGDEMKSLIGSAIADRIKRRILNELPAVECGGRNRKM